MLASITPLGERARGSRWGLTVGFFLAGSTLAAAAAGAVAGELGHLVWRSGARSDARVAVLPVSERVTPLRSRAKSFQRTLSSLVFAVSEIPFA